MSASFQPLVSIITPVYNGERFLDSLIQSVQEQDYPNFEHIIIDDGSTDGGATINLLKNYSHLRWWTRPNRGQYATMNEGLEAAKGEFICFVSADDKLEKGAISCVMNYMKSHLPCDCVYGYTAYMFEDGKPYLPIVPFRGLPFRSYRYFFHVQHCSLYIRRKVILEKNICFNEQLHYVGDYDWLIRLFENHLNIEFIQATLSWVRVHEGQVSIQNRKRMRTELFRVAKFHNTNPCLFWLSLILNTWAFNLYKLFYTLKYRGLVGGKGLILNWFHRRITLQSK